MAAEWNYQDCPTLQQDAGTQTQQTSKPNPDGITSDVKVCDDGMLIQLLCFRTLCSVLFVCKTHRVSETGFCLRLQVKPTQLGPIDGASPYLRTANGDRIQSPKRCVFQIKRRTMQLSQFKSLKRVPIRSILIRVRDLSECL
jgi:hypothetical protein